MRKERILFVFLLSPALAAAAQPAAVSAVDTPPPHVYRVDVNLMVLSFSVTDNRGHYVTGLKPETVAVSEDGIPQSIRSLTEASATLHAPGTERNVFILFDTSSHVYESYVYEQEAVMQFIRELDPADRIAVYKFSRNLFRLQPATADHAAAVRAVRGAVVGDVTALYDALLLTVRDAARLPGHKVIVVFSGGIDNGSILGPDDVRRTAEEEGIPIYVVSSRTPNPISTAALGRLAHGTGGLFYRAPQWKDQLNAFRAIRDEFSNSYTVTYYPENPNHGFRRISVQLRDRQDGSYHIRARPGYQPKPDAAATRAAYSPASR